MFRFRPPAIDKSPRNCTKEELEEELEKLRESSKMALDFNYEEIQRLQKDKKDQSTAMQSIIDELTDALNIEREQRINLEIELRIAKKGGGDKGGGDGGGENAEEDTQLQDGIDTKGWGRSSSFKDGRSTISFNTAITSDSTRSEKNGSSGPLHRATAAAIKASEKFKENHGDIDAEEDDEDCFDEELMKQHFSHMTFHELELTLQSKLIQVARLERKIQKQKKTIDQLRDEVDMLRVGAGKNGNGGGSNDDVVKQLVERITLLKNKLNAKDQEMQEVSEVMTQWVQGKGEEIKKLANMIKLQKDQITFLTNEIEKQKAHQQDQQQAI